MSRLRDAVARPDIVAPGGWRGTIASTVTGPSDLVSVVVPGVSGFDLLGPCQWMPRIVEETRMVGTPPQTITVGVPRYPSNGDECLVAFDDSGLPWVVVWWPT